jgi:RNA 3'-terminal phosphate cyclase-like protein
MIEAARSVLNRYIPDTYLYSDVYKGEESGKYVQFVSYQARLSLYFARSPGYALSLVADTTTSALHCAEELSRALRRRTWLFKLRNRYSLK